MTYPVPSYRDLGDLSAVDPVYSRTMYCDACMVRWLGCWDAFECPQCGQGELPSCDVSRFAVTLNPPHEANR